MEDSTMIGRLTSDDILLSKRKIKIRLTLKDKIEELVLTLINIFYLSHSLLNFVSLSLLNNVKIYHYNKDQILYNLKREKILAFTK